MRNGTRVVEEASSVAKRQFVDRGNQQSLTAYGRDITPVCAEVETIGDRGSINDFRRERGWGISADVALALGPNVAGLQSKAAARAVVQFGLQSLVVH